MIYPKWLDRDIIVLKACRQKLQILVDSIYRGVLAKKSLEVTGILN